ncbi:ABC transporter ATP-binding protein [Erysipelothrix aquatica]|uniref:ATP-binding cassette domain-containing protein n=1 Tax=Erysipelothrix aquatica TaxID=2683714 RepID=UPI001359546E|nr:ABC transporter ATP-binding protein [Erysipelothrix aquatica]
MYIKMLSLAQSYRFRASIEIFIKFFDSFVLLTTILAVYNLFLNRLHYFVGIIVLLCIVKIIALSKQTNFIIKWSQSSVDNILLKYIESVYKNSQWGIKDEEMVEIVSGDIDSLKKIAVFYEEIIPQFVLISMYYLCLFVVSVYYRSTIFLIFIIVITLIHSFHLLIKKYRLKIYKARESSYINIKSKFIENIKGLNTIMMYDVDDYFQKIFESSAEKYRKNTMDSLSVNLLESNIRITIANAGIIVVTLLLVNMDKIPFEMKTLMLYLNILIFMSTKKFAYANKQIKMIEPVLKRVLSLINSVNNYSVEKNKQTIETTINSISLHNLSFSYKKTKRILDNVTFEFRKGKLYSIVGENGAGKSTLVALIKERMLVDEGSIKINSMNIGEIKRSYLNAQIAVIPKTSFLFNATVRDNLMHALDSSMKFDDAIEQLKYYKLLNFVHTLPEGFDTNVGENGCLLSPGQKQQLVIAMFIIKNRDVYILDEATSSINPDNSEIILDALNKLKRDKIVINITHKFSDIQKADEIVFINKGEIKYGSHQHLLMDESYMSLCKKLGRES